MNAERKPAARVATVLLALLFPVLILACGGGSSPASEPSPSPSADDSAGPTPTSTATPLPTAADPQQGMEHGQQALREGRFEDAAALFRAAAEASSDPAVQAAAATGNGVALIEQGNTSEGLEQLRQAVAAAPEGTGEQRRAAYVLGRRLNGAGEYAETVEVLGPVVDAAGGGLLQPYIDAVYAEALAETGESEAAADAWDRALEATTTPDSLRADILEQRATAAADAGNDGEALQWLGQLVDVAPTPADRFSLAELARELGEDAIFRVQMGTIIELNPGSDWALRAVEALEEAGTPAPRENVGYVYYRHRQYEQARETFALALEEDDLSPAELAYRTYYLAASYEDDGFAEQAIPLYDRATTYDPGSPYTHRAMYWAARSTETIGDPEGASQRYADLASKGPGGQFSTEAAFRAGYVLLKAEDPQGAVDTWNRLGVAKDARALYWEGRAHAELGQNAEARAAYDAARNRDPFGFYGLEAARELGQETAIDGGEYEPLPRVEGPEWDAIAAWLNAGREAAAPPPAESAAGDLLLVGLRNEAIASLEAVDAEPLAKVRAAWDLGLRDVSARMMERLADSTGEARHRYPLDVLKVLYPVDYVTLLDEIAREGGFDPLLFAGLIRTESAWNPTAVSVANAIGLTQVIPATGEAIARSLGYDGWETGHLVRPAVSLAFGANYISTQLEEMDSVPAALAAYNAGPSRARRWLEVAPGDIPADYVEAVSISETRNYIELVMSAWAYYERAWRDD